MEGGGGKVGYKIFVEGAVEVYIRVFSRTFNCRPGCSNGSQTTHYRPIAGDWSLVIGHWTK